MFPSFEILINLKLSKIELDHKKIVKHISVSIWHIFEKFDTGKHRSVNRHPNSHRSVIFFHHDKIV